MATLIVYTPTATNAYQRHVKEFFPNAFEDVTKMIGVDIFPKVLSYFQKYGIEREHAVSYTYAICTPIYRAYINSRRQSLAGPNNTSIVPISNTEATAIANDLTQQNYSYITDDIELDNRAFIDISNSVVQTIPDADTRLIKSVQESWITGQFLNNQITSAQSLSPNELIVVTDSYKETVAEALFSREVLIELGYSDFVDSIESVEVSNEPVQFSSDLGLPPVRKKKRPRT